LDKIKSKLNGILPEKKRMTALEEAEFEDYNDADGGFGRERMLRDFENARVFKPRLLVHGARGMGQGYIGAAVLHHFEGFHVQTVNLPILMGDPSRTAEVALIQIFVELKRHKPSVLYIPDFENWFQAVSEELITTFTHLLNSISPSEPILLFGLTSEEITKIDPAIVRDFFGYTRKCRLAIDKPDEVSFVNILFKIWIVLTVFRHNVNDISQALLVISKNLQMNFQIQLLDGSESCKIFLLHRRPLLNSNRLKRYKKTKKLSSIYDIYSRSS